MSGADKFISDTSTTVDRLDAYLAALQSGQQPDKARVLAQDPALADHLDCLEVLEKLAPPGQAAAIEDPGLEPTLPAVSPSTDIAYQAEPRTAPGATFGQYELIRELGRGGMGVVYLAKQHELDRLVALKMILSNFLASEEIIHRFHLEAKAAARLRHPNIVQVFDSGQRHGQYYFAMDYVDGGSLESRLRPGPMAADEAAALLLPVARAVAHLHEHGVIHRDLKPSNILIDQAGQPYLTDFGLAKMLEDEGARTTTGTIIGTPCYMAPEQAASGRGVSPLSDVYSLGAILYEMLTGRPPFREATAMDTLVQVLEGEPMLPRQIKPSIPRNLELICLKCLEKAPVNRYPSAAALASDLEHFLRGEGVEAQPQGPMQKLVRWARRQPALASRLLSLCVFIAIVQANYHLNPTVRPGVHALVLAMLAAWGLCSWGCQRLLAKPRWASRVPFLWALLDTLLFSAMVYVSDNQASPVLIGFPAVIVAAGLWFRVGVVWFTTTMTVAGYLATAVLKNDVAEWLSNPHYVVIFIAAQVVIGFMVAYQVQRVRVLSRYYEHRPLP